MNRNLKKGGSLAGLVAAVTFMVFSPALQNGFINWDDDKYVYDNLFIRSFDSRLLKSAFLGFHASNWHPLTWFSHALDYAIWGLNPLGHHLTNNILHSINTFIVVLLVMKLMATYKRTAENDGIILPFLNKLNIKITALSTGLLFGIHPLRVESVAWVAERKDLLCAFFFLLSIMSYLTFILNRPHKRYYFLTLLLFIFALISKPMAITLPFVLLILDWYVFRRINSWKTFRKACIEKLPFFVLALVSSVLTILAQEAGGAISGLEATPLTARLIVCAESLVSYLTKMIMPLNLVPYYPYPENISSVRYAIPILIVLAVTAACIALARKQRILISLWSYYVISLAPVLGIVQVGSQSMADRYTYLPGLGPFILVGLLAAKAYEKISLLSRWRAIFRIGCLVTAIAVLTSLSYATMRQIGVWENSIVFWNYVIAREPFRDFLPHHNLAITYLESGNIDGAINEYLAELKINPDNADAHNNLGAAYEKQGHFDKAADEYKVALRLDPRNYQARFNLQIVTAKMEEMKK